MQNSINSLSVRIRVLWGSFLDLKPELVWLTPLCTNHRPEEAGGDPSPGHHLPHYVIAKFL